METATENIKLFMKGQGSLTLKIKNQSYFDKTKTRVKKRVLKCPCSGVYKPRMRGVDGGRQTTTKKSGYVNLNVNSQTGKRSIACRPRCAAELMRARDMFSCTLQLKPA